MPTLQEVQQRAQARRQNRQGGSGQQDGPSNFQQAQTAARRRASAQQAGQRRERPGLGQSIVGAGETILTMGSGALAEPIAGVSGLVETITSAIRGEDDAVGQGVDRINSLRELLTYQPRTRAGRESLQAVSRPFQVIADAADEAGWAVADVTGSPAAGAAVRTGIELIPGAMGVRPGVAREGMRARQRGRDVERATGVDIGTSPRELGQQVRASAEWQTGGRTGRAENFEQIQRAVQDARQNTKNYVDALYEDARTARAGIRSEQAREFPRIAREALEDFDTGDMPTLRRRLKELETLENLEPGSVAELEGFSRFRKRITKNPGGDNAERAANAVLKGQLDEFLDAQFNADMIEGSPQALQKWKNARTAHREYAETFKDNKTIRQLAEQQATPEEIRRWITGASAVGAKPQALDVVRRLKNIVGEDSPEFSAIRQDMALDIMEPLLREQPNTAMFQSKYDNFVHKHPDLAREVFGESLEGMKGLRDITRAAGKTATQTEMLDINQALAQGLFGHQIARGGLRQRVARVALDRIRAAASPNQRRRILGELTGYDPTTSILQRTPIGVAGAAQTGMRQERPQEESVRPAGQRPSGSSWDPSDRPQVPQSQ